MWSSGTAQPGVDAAHYLEVQNTREITLFRRDATKMRIRVWSRTKGALVGPSPQDTRSSASSGFLGFLADLACTAIEQKLNEALQPKPAETRASEATLGAVKAMREAQQNQHMANLMIDHLRRR